MHLLHRAGRASESRPLSMCLPGTPHTLQGCRRQGHTHPGLGSNLGVEKSVGVVWCGNGSESGVTGLRGTTLIVGVR
jgi:hypothetical protein